MTLQPWLSWTFSQPRTPNTGNARPVLHGRNPWQSGKHHTGSSVRNGAYIPEREKRAHTRHVPTWNSTVTLEVREGRVEALVADVSSMGMGLLVDVNKAEHYIGKTPKIIIPGTGDILPARVLHRFPDSKKEELKVGLQLGQSISSYTLNKILYPKNNLQISLRFGTLVIQGDSLDGDFLMVVRHILKEHNHQRIDLRGLKHAVSGAIALLHSEMKRGIPIIGMNREMQDTLAMWQNFDRRYPTHEAYVQEQARLAKDFYARSAK